MPKDFPRAHRIAQQIQRDLAELIQREIDTSGANLITLTGVEVTRDYSFAKVFYTVLGDENGRVDIAQRLEQARGFFRAQLAQGIRLFKMPELQFVYDDSIEKGVALDRLIAQATADSAGTA